MKVPAVILFTPVFFRYIPTAFELIVPPVPSKLLVEPSTYTPVPVVVVIVPAFFPELVPVPPTYIPRLAPAVIVPPAAFSATAVFPVWVSAAIPTTDLFKELAVPFIAIAPELIPLPSSTYIPILSSSFIVIVPVEVNWEPPPTYEPIFSDFPATDVILELFTKVIPSAAYIPILSLLAILITEPFVTVPDAVPLL